VKETENMVNLTVYGYRLGQHCEVEFIPYKRCLIASEALGHSVETLRPTMSNLLEYLLTNSVGKIVPDIVLQKQVWEKNGLSCSSQRLWQVMNNLKNKLLKVGLQDNFILRIPGKGYTIPSEFVLQLYCRTSAFSMISQAAPAT
jgi:DNA-binding winged helix-turn-helix (wHTH) protein